MMTTTCPSCGKPIRPGTKFCGNCGRTITASTPKRAAISPSDREYTDSQPPVSSCPHCGKPLRTSARFCNNCGKSIPEGIHPEGVVPQACPVVTPAGAPTYPYSQVSTTEPVHPSRDDRQPTRKRMWTGVIIGLFSIVCILVLASVLVYLKDPFGWFKKLTSTPTATQIIPTEEILESLEPGAIITPTLTAISPLESLVTPDATTSSVGYPPIATSPVPLDTPTDVITASVVPTSSQQGHIQFTDDFSTSISEFWKPWGDPKSWPSIKRAPEANRLDLVAYETPGAAGVTSKLEISSSPGVEIIFEAQLNPNYPQFPLIFDWDPLTDPRNMDSKNLGVVHLEIKTDKLVLVTPYQQQSTCMRLISGSQKNTYHLKFIENQGVLMYVDDQLVEPCSLPNMGKPPKPGRISFTGMGWLTSVKVIEP